MRVPPLTPVLGSSVKTCSKCGVEKSLEEFPVRKDSSDGRRAQCRECRQSSQKLWIENNRDHVRQYFANYYENNRLNKISYQRAYVDMHRSQIYASQKQRYQRNPEPHRHRARNRRTSLLSLPSERVTIRQVATRDGVHCWICGDELSEWNPSNLDHLVPVAADPDLLNAWGLANPGTVLANMALTCPSCNSRKSNKILPCAIARYLKNLGGANDHEGLTSRR